MWRKKMQNGRYARFSDMQEYVGMWIRTGRQESQMENVKRFTRDFISFKNDIINVTIVLSF